LIPVQVFEAKFAGILAIAGNAIVSIDVMPRKTTVQIHSSQS